jgi:hypothetical protein
MVIQLVLIMRIMFLPIFLFIYFFFYFASTIRSKNKLALHELFSAQVRIYLVLIPVEFNTVARVTIVKCLNVSCTMYYGFFQVQVGISKPSF